VVERGLNASHDAVGIQPSRPAAALLDRARVGIGVLDRRQDPAVEQVRCHDRETVAGQPIGEIAHDLVQSPPGMEQQDRRPW
jgi:hypothetical protein